MSDPTYSEFLDGFRGLYQFLNKLSNALESYRNWYQRNAATIKGYITAFADFGVWCSAVQRMTERQIVFTDLLSNDFAKIIYSSSNVDATILDYYIDNGEQRMNALISRCENAKQIVPFKTLFEQIVFAYHNGHYQLACVGLFSILDGILTEITLDKSTNFKNRLESIKNKLSDRIELSDIDRQLWCIYVSMDSFKDSIFHNSDLKENESDELNRHWVMHGRTRKQYTNLDFLKALLSLDAIIFLDNAGKRANTNETEQ